MICCRKMLVFAGLVLAVSLTAAADYHPGFIQAKMPTSSSVYGYDAITNLLAQYAPEKIDLTLTTLMAETMCSDSSVYVLNPVSGRSWNWANSNGGFAYEGQMYMVAGVTYTFWGECDDRARVYVDGTLLLTGSTGSGASGSVTPTETGWHDLNLCIWDSSGGKGTQSSHYGFAWNTNGLSKTGGYLDRTTAGWHPLTDPGDGSLFRHAVNYDSIKVWSSTKNYGTPAPYYGYAAVTNGEMRTFLGPGENYTNDAERVYYSCDGWRFTHPDGTVESGAGRTFSLTPSAATIGGTLTWCYESHEVPPTEYYVVPPGTPGVTPTAPYATWKTAATSIADALAAAGQYSRLNLLPGVYDVSTELAIARKGTTIRSQTKEGALARETTILDGGYPARTNRLFNVTAEGTKLQGLTLRNAAVSGNGGAVYAQAKGFTCDTCTISNCCAGFNADVARYGGGILIANNYSGVMITNSLFAHCAARMGGGISCGVGTLNLSKWATRDTVPIISDCTFVSNRCYASVKGGSGATSHPQGAAVLGSFWVEHSLFRANFQLATDTYGGALSLDQYAVATNCVFEGHLSADCGTIAGRADCYGSGKCLLTRCIFRNNSPRYVFSSAAYVENCQIVSNVFSKYDLIARSTELRNLLIAYNQGAFGAGNFTYDNCTIVSNDFGFCLLAHGNAPTIRNCVSYGNTGAVSRIGSTYLGTADFCFERGWSANGKRLGTYRNDMILGCGALPIYSGGGKTFAFADLDPTGGTSNVIATVEAKGVRFVDPQKDNWRLHRRSPLRDAGMTLGWMTGATDLDVNPRVLDTRKGLPTPAALPDIGCYECAIPRPGAALILR